jgi:hypothetical protein
MYATFVVGTTIKGCKYINSPADWKNSAGTNSCVTSSGGESAYYSSLDTGLVGYWKMNETGWSGITGEVTDETTNNLDGTGQGDATTTKLGFDRSGIFDGNGDYVSVSDSGTSPLDITGDFTLSAWFKRTGGYNEYIISKTNDASDGGYGLLIGSSGELYCRTANTSGWDDSVTDIERVVVGDNFHHLLAVRNGTSCRIYIDGVDATAYPSTHTTITDNNNPLSIGSQSNGTDQFAEGEIDDVRIYDRALTEEEITKLYQYMPEKVYIDDASDIGSTAGLPGGGRQIVRTNSGATYSFLNNGGNCEMWKSTDGISWVQQQSGTSIACTAQYPVAAAIDNNQDIHVVYPNAATVRYRNYDTATDDWDAGGEATVHTFTSAATQVSISVDSNNIPHLVAVGDNSTNYEVRYLNRIGGSWTRSVQVVVAAATIPSVDMTIDTNNYPEIIRVNSSNSLDGYVGDANDASSFTSNTIDSSVSSTAGQDGASIAVDTLTGNTWVSYIDSDGTVALAKHTGATWTSNWTNITSKTDIGYQPSIVIAGLSDVYVFYTDDSTDQKIAYDVYHSEADSPSWTGETVLQTPGSGVDFKTVKVKWSFEWNNYGADRIDYLFSDGTDVYYNRMLLASTPGTQDAIDDLIPEGLSKNISTVADASGNIHLAWIDDSTPEHVQYKKYSSGSWDGSATQIDSSTSEDNAYVSVSVDTNNNDIYVIYLRNGTVYFNKYSGSWGGETDTGWTAGTNPTSLTSNYQGNGKIFAEWTSENGSLSTVNWDYIIVPENIWLMITFIPLAFHLIKRKKKSLAQIRCK